MGFNLSSEVFTFGKYKNSKVEDIIEINPNYVKWALDNVKYFTLNSALSKKLEDKLQITRYYSDCYSKYACDYSSGYISMQDAFYDYNYY